MSPIPQPRRVLTLVGSLLTAAVLASCGTAGGGVAGGEDPQTSGGAAAEEMAASVNAEECGKETRNIKHDQGTTTVTGSPTRVAVLEFSFVDAVVNLGMRPVGIADDDNPDRIIPPLRGKVGDYTPLGLRASPNLQVITSLKPDLIVSDSTANGGIYGQLSKIAPTIAVASDSASYEETVNSQLVIAQAIGKCEEMEERLSRHEEIMQGLRDRIPDDESRKVLFAIATEVGVTGYTPRGFTPGVLASLGLESPLPDDNDDFHVSLSLETLVSLKPDVIFLAPHPGQLLIDQWATTPLWDTVPAVQEDAVYKMVQNLWSRARGLEAAEQIGEEAIEALYGAA